MVGEGGDVALGLAAALVDMDVVEVGGGGEWDDGLTGQVSYNFAMDNK